MRSKMLSLTFLALFLVAPVFATPDSNLGAYTCDKTVKGEEVPDPKLRFSLGDKYFITINFRDGNEFSGYGMRRVTPGGKSFIYGLGNLNIHFLEDGSIVYQGNWSCRKD